MTNKILDMPVGHDFAPGSEPEFGQLFIEQFMKIVTTPAFLSALALFLLGMTGFIIYRIVARNERKLDKALERDKDVIKQDLAELRRSRQRKAQEIPKFDKVG